MGEKLVRRLNVSRGPGLKESGEGGYDQNELTPISLLSSHEPLPLAKIRMQVYKYGKHGRSKRGGRTDAGQFDSKLQRKDSVPSQSGDLVHPPTTRASERKVMEDVESKSSQNNQEKKVEKESKLFKKRHGAICSLHLFLSCTRRKYENSTMMMFTAEGKELITKVNGVNIILNEQLLRQIGEVPTEGIRDYALEGNLTESLSRPNRGTRSHECSPSGE
ncbi:hypothetical protein HAX54_052354 [Datura stramonium]|uniref:Uncharacterized protein n=1 Tax=Datura stramonium TaxID=4076 RepID=A0ABS8WR11_DATST|nr:hypothetical protein [Datura stramonium]